MEVKQNFWSELYQLLFEGVSPAYMTGAIIFILIGTAVMMYLNALQRNKESDNTPYRFSVRFRVKDNRWRPAANVVVAFVAVQFFHEFTGMTVNMFFCFCIGLGFDYLLILLREFSFIVRKKMGASMEKYKEANQIAKDE